MVKLPAVLGGAAFAVWAACGPSTGTPSAPTHTASGDDPPAPAPDAEPAVTTRCELTPEAVRCHSTNPSTRATVACVEPFLVVKDTADLYSGKRRWCSGVIGGGATRTYDVLDDVRPAELCGPTLDGCFIHIFGGQGASVERIAAFARELEAATPHPGGTQPTMAECDATRRAWIASPELAAKYRSSLRLDDADMINVFCKLHLSRADVACLGKARTEAEVEACAPLDEPAKPTP